MERSKHSASYVRNKQGVIQDAQKTRRNRVIELHFVVSKIRIWTMQSKSTNGASRFVVMDSHAVFAEQRSSASHMIAAKVFDVISWLPDCEGEASDAVSADTQEKMEDAPSNWYAHHDLEAQNRGTTCQILWHDWKENCADSH